MRRTKIKFVAGQDMICNLYIGVAARTAKMAELLTDEGGEETGIPGENP